MPTLVCQYCKKPIYAGGGSEAYLHANSGSAECANPQLEGLKNKATAYDNNTTYINYRADLITQMTNMMFSYAEAQSPAELLDMILADSRHFADVHQLAFEEHNRRSYQLYLDNASEPPLARQCCDASTLTADSNVSPKVATDASTSNE